MPLVNHYHAALVRFAMVYVSDRSVAEEVAQATWLGVLEGIGRFEGRSSLKTWIFRILANQAKTRAVRESRTIPFSELPAELPILDRSDSSDNVGITPSGGYPDYEPAVASERFRPADDPRWPHHWLYPPTSWGESPEQLLLASEVRSYREDDSGTTTCPAGSDHATGYRGLQLRRSV